jgi:hypothetical protein
VHIFAGYSGSSCRLVPGSLTFSVQFKHRCEFYTKILVFGSWAKKLDLYSHK